jgi:antitoxin MazE
MQVSRWGNSLAVRLPAAVVERLGLKEGDEIEIVAGDGTMAVHRKPTAEEVLERLKKYEGRLPADWMFDRDEATSRGE